MADDVATVIERASAHEPASASVLTPELAIAVFEARRARAFAVALATLCAVALVLVLALGGDRLALAIHGGGIATTGLAALAYLAFVGADTRRYRTWKLAGLAYVAILTNGTGFFYWGVFSAYGSVVTVSAYAFSSGSGKKTVFGGLLLSVALHGGLGIAQIAGWLPVRGWIVPIGMSVMWQLVFLAVLQLILIGGFVLGIHAYDTMQRVLDEQHVALRELARRDAQLAEAHQEAREARLPGEGRHTGTQLGRFRLGAVLGRGAMGEVYAATDDAGDAFAVKVLAAHLLDNADALRRFHREARAIANLAAPNIVKMIEVSAPGAAWPYLAMERLEGDDLGQLIKRQPVRDVGEVASIVRAVAAGLDSAHDAGVVHRDLKPANVFAAKTPSGVTWKILDFGVSKLFDGDATMTTGHLVGTPGYMAPEQARGEAIDRRADVYALGVVVYRLLTGRPAVIPSDTPQMLHEVVFRMPPQPSSLASVPPQVEAVLAVALAKSADARFATAGEFAAAFAEAAAGFASPPIVDRAAALLRRAPWGQWLRGRADTRAETRARTASD